jgi:FtsZ-binding cell division protein ZapB
LVANKFNLTDTFKRLEKATSKPVTIQDLQHEINNLKVEIRELKQTQNNHHYIIEQLQHYEGVDDNPAETDPIDINQNFTESHDKQEEEDFLGLINQLKIQNFYINIKIIIKEFVLEITTLFDTGADSNCILEGLIPTKYFEKTSEQLSTASGSKLKINYKLSTTIIENQNLKIDTPFLLVKNLKNKVILFTFHKITFPFTDN